MTPRAVIQVLPRKRLALRPPESHEFFYRLTAEWSRRYQIEHLLVVNLHVGAYYSMFLLRPRLGLLKKILQDPRKHSS
jgi:hypothetical protein